MGFELHTRKIGGVVIMEAAGRLTLADAQTKIRDIIHVFTAEGARKFILILARVESIDSYGVGELVRIYSVVRQMGGEMKLADVSPRVLEVLNISHLQKVFEICSEETALRAFGQRG